MGTPAAAAAVVRRIIILESTDPGVTMFKLILWARPPEPRVPYWASIAPQNSAYVDATQHEVQDIKAGEIVEKQDTAEGATPEEVQAAAQAKWMDFNRYVQGHNPWSQYGSYWDGTAWVPGGLP